MAVVFFVAGPLEFIVGIVLDADDDLVGLDPVHDGFGCHAEEFGKEAEAEVFRHRRGSGSDYSSNWKEEEKAQSNGLL